MKISTLYESADEFYLDINIYAKNKSASARDYNELKEQFYKEFEEQKPLPTLQERRYQVSDLVSDDYKITNTEQLVLGSNERLLDLHTVSSVEKLPQLEGVVPLDVVKMFSYENTMNISDIESYLEGAVEGYKGNSNIIGTTSVRKDLQLTDSEISDLETGKTISTERGTESDEMSFTSDDEVAFTSDDEVAFDSDDEVEFDEFEFDTNKDTKVQFSIEKYPVISYFQISVYIEPYDVVDLDSDFSIEFSIEPYDVLNLGSESVTFSIEDYDVIDLNEGGTEDEDYEDYDDSDEDYDEEDYDDDSDEDVDDSDEDEEDYEDYDEEDYDDDDSDEDEEDYDDDDSDEGIDDSDEDSDEDEGSLGSEIQELEPKDSKESTGSTQNLEDNFFSGISYAEDKEEKPTVVDTKQEKQQNNIPTEDIISVEEKPTDIRKFLRSHPRSTIAEVCKYFSKEEINKAILTGKIVKRGNKLHI